MSPLKKGTKLTDNPKNIRLEMRLTKRQGEMLNECAEMLNVTKTDIVVKGIEMVHNELKQK